MSAKPPIPDDLTREAMWDIILELRAELEAARAEIAELKTQLGKPKKTSCNSSIPSSQTIKERRENRRARRGGKVGHAGKSRENQEADQIMECRAGVCPDCGTDLSAAPQRLLHPYQIVDIPPVQVQVIEVRRYQAVCGCGCCVSGEAPAGYAEPQQGFGPNIHALLSYFNGTHHIAHHRLKSLMEGVFGLSISAGAIAKSLHRTAEKLAKPAESILQDIRQSAVIGSDETSLRVDGQNGWLWVLQTPTASYFAAANSRAGAVLEKLMADAVAEVWCCDLGSAQLTAPARRFAICNAHYLRKLQYAIDAGDTTFAPAFQFLLREALHLSRARDALPDVLYEQQVALVKATARSLLTWETVNEERRKLKKSFTKHFDKIRVFLERPDVPFDNNASERALPPAVIHRRVIGGFRTHDGAAAAPSRTPPVNASNPFSEPSMMYSVCPLPYSPAIHR